MHILPGTSPEKDAARCDSQRSDERATFQTLAGLGAVTHNAPPSFLGSGDAPMAGHTGVVVRLPRQVRRGVALEAREGVFPNGLPYAFVWFEFQAGRDQIGTSHGFICGVKANAEAQRLAKSLGLPFIDRTQLGHSAPLPGAA